MTSHANFCVVIILAITGNVMCVIVVAITAAASSSLSLLLGGIDINIGAIGDGDNKSAHVPLHDTGWLDDDNDSDGDVTTTVIITTIQCT